MTTHTALTISHRQKQLKLDTHLAVVLGCDILIKMKIILVLLLEIYEL